MTMPKEYLMKHVSLGGLDVSRIGLGAMTMVAERCQIFCVSSGYLV
jgi:hypothetical protein